MTDAALPNPETNAAHHTVGSTFSAEPLLPGAGQVFTPKLFARGAQRVSLPIVVASTL
jgi:hypothetical protein